MPTTLRLLRKEITYSEARREEVDILRRLQYYDQQQEFFVGLAAQTELIKAIVTHHLGLFSTAQCQVAGVEEWLHGSYNVCIPVSIRDWNVRAQSGTRVLLRLPLPYRLGEDFRPGNADEKIRCEAGTYAWLQGNCPDIPIPRLYVCRFGWSDSTVSPVDSQFHELTTIFSSRTSVISPYQVAFSKMFAAYSFQSLGTRSLHPTSHILPIT